MEELSDAKQKEGQGEGELEQPPDDTAQAADEKTADDDDDRVQNLAQEETLNDDGSEVGFDILCNRLTCIPLTPPSLPIFIHTLVYFLLTCTISAQSNLSSLCQLPRRSCYSSSWPN